MEQEETNKPSGYSGRPLWQWTLIYLVIGGIIYGLLYYFVFAKRGYNYSSSSSSGTQTQSSQSGY